MGILNKEMALNIAWIYSLYLRHSSEHLGFCCTRKKSTGFCHDIMQRKALWKECVYLCQGFSLLDIMIVVHHLVLCPLILAQQWMMRGWLPDLCHLEGREEILSLVKTHKKIFFFSYMQPFSSQMQSASTDSCGQTTWTNLCYLCSVCLLLLENKAWLTILW